MRLLVLALLFALLAALRISAPNDFFEGDQSKQIGYVMDILHHGHWATQFEVDGRIATKPPLYNWCAAALSTIAGTTAPWVMKLPSLLAALGILVLIYKLASRLFDETTAFYTCLMCIASHHFSKLMWFARTDMLMTFLVYLAITLVVTAGRRWWKSPLIGLVVAAAFLAKGPVGPCLFGLFLMLWSLREGRRLRLRTLRDVAPGLLAFAAITGAWVAAVWQIPDFHEFVLQGELARRLPGAVEGTKPFHYYLPHFFTRIAPWSSVAVIAVGVLSRQPGQWKRIRFVAVWGIAFFVFFSVIPSKRHDLLLPVYPVVFLLAGYGVGQILHSHAVRQLRWLIYPAAACLVVSPLVLARGGSAPGIFLTLGMCGAGAAAVVTWQRRHWGTVVSLSVGLVFAHGLYHHQFATEARVGYAEFREFLDTVRAETGTDRVLLFHAHPLIAYEFDQHERYPHPSDLLEERPKWLIAPDPELPIIRSWTCWDLDPVCRMDFGRLRTITATLFRVEPANLLTPSGHAVSALFRDVK